MTCLRAFRCGLAVERRLLCGLLALLALAGGFVGPTIAADGDLAVRFVGEIDVESDEGHVQLVWETLGEAPANIAFELESAATASFDEPRRRYRGPDRASFVSGLDAGTTYFRVRARSGDAPGPWAEPLAVTVRYAPWWQVRLLMAIGLLVFVATAATIVAGHRAHARDRATESAR